MAKTKSAKKALRQSVRRRAQNLRRAAAYKRAVKSVRDLVAEKKYADAAKNLPALYAAIDKAAKTNVISKNKASRLKSRLTKLAAKGPGK